MDYSRYTSLSISRRGAHGDVLDIQMRADAPGGNGKLPTSGLRGHWELSEIWRDLGADDSVRCAVLRGDGLGFSGGGDLAMVQAIADDFVARAQVWKEARDLVYNIINCDKPIVSAMHGPAVGAGLVAGLLADISIATKKARIVDGHTRLGVAAGDHAAIVWPLLCSMAKAKYYLLLCEPISGEEAERIGLVSLAVESPTGSRQVHKLQSAGLSTRSTTGCGRPARLSIPRWRWSSWALVGPTCRRALPRCASAARPSFKRIAQP